jgi:outer membrane protein insertion porin family
MLLVGAAFSGNGWAETFKPFKVTDIQVEGLQRVALGAALLNLPLKVCMPQVTSKIFRFPVMVMCW